MSSDRKVFTPDQDAIGDWTAPEGSELWARALRIGLQRCVDKVGMYPEQMRGLIDKALTHTAWSKLPDPNGKPFDTWESFCAARQPFGLGHPWSELRPFVEAAAKGNKAVVAGITTKPAKAHGGQKNNTNAESKDSSLNENEGSDDYLRNERGSDYLASRIARDAPEVHERMVAGEFPSVRAAALAAGIVKPIDPMKRARSAFRKLNPEQRAEFLAWVAKQ